MGEEFDCARPAGVFHRRIELVAHAGEVRCALEDDYHHFRVAVRHDGRCVTGVASRALRFPWSACVHADENWLELVGAPITFRASDIAKHVEMRLFCTHMFELAGLALAHLAFGRRRRLYRAAVPYGGRAQEPAWLECDGERVLQWIVKNDVVQGAGPIGDRPLRRGFARWVEDSLSPKEGEFALVLRRAVLISSGRLINLDARPHAAAGGGCYATQPERATSARRQIGSTLNFDGVEGTLLMDDRAWLEGRAETT